MFYVYEHIRNDTGECFYIGKGKGSRHISSKGRSVYWNRIVNKANGFHSKIIADNLTENEAFAFEIVMIDGAKKSGVVLCNIAKGGKGSSGFRHSLEHRELKRKQMLENNPMLNHEIRKKHQSTVKQAMIRPEVRKKQSESRMGMKFSEQHKANLSKSHIGICARGDSASAKIIKFNDKIFNCIMDLADYVGVKHKTMYTRIARNPQRWGYEVLK